MNEITQPEPVTADLSPAPDAAPKATRAPRKPQHAAEVVKVELQKYQILRRQLEDMDGMDIQTLTDTLEGETDLREVLLVLVDEIKERESAANGIGTYIADLQARKGRYDKTVETLRTVVLQAMDRAGLDKIAGERCTLSTRPVAPKLVVEDEALVPAAFFTPGAPKLDKDALLQAVNARLDKLATCTTDEEKAAVEDIPGATLSAPGISLTIRVK